MCEDALRDAGEALAGVEQILEDGESVQTSSHASYSGAMMLLVVDQLEMRLQWAQRLRTLLTAN